MRIAARDWVSSSGAPWMFVSCPSGVTRVAFPAVYGQIRRALLRRFPYGIFYTLEEDVIVILACFHTKRDPKTMRNRT